MTEKELLLTALLNCKRVDLYTKGYSLDRGQKEKLSLMFQRRQKGEPVQYITAFTEFMGFYLKTDKRALIPRPETEILVEKTLELIKNNYSAKTLNILDLGTGSGNIAISLAKFLENVQVLATDISKEALELARENAKINEVENKITFLESNLFETGFKEKKNFFDIIVSNPPYLTSQEIETSMVDLSYEPRLALDAGRDGLKFYRRIIKVAGKYLKTNGYLIFEIGYKQLGRIVELVVASGEFIIDRIIKDYNNIDRVIFLKRINHG